MAAVGGRRGRPALVESAQHAALGVFVLVTACLLLLIYAFLTFDFSVRYVANNTNLGTPFYYRITAVWGALEGSIVLWSWLLSVYTLIVILRHRTSARELYPVGAHGHAVGDRVLPAGDDGGRAGLRAQRARSRPTAAG
jgi:cytochrome c biogenesis factor